MSDNFEFIKDYKNIYENVKYAEKLLETSTSVLELGSYENQMRKTIETMINKLIKEYGVVCDERLDLRNKIDILYNKGIIDSNSKDNYHTMRMEGNPGSHAHETMDTRSAKNYYDEKRRKDENAFKRLFVECHAFVEIYMPKASQYNGVNPDFEEDKKSVNIYQDKSDRNIQAVPKQSSVTYGSSNNKNKFTEEIQYHNYSLARFIEVYGSCGIKLIEVFVVLYIVFGILSVFGILRIVVPENNALGNSQATYLNNHPSIPIIFIVLISFVIPAWLIGFCYGNWVAKKNKFAGTVKFGNHTLTISKTGTKDNTITASINLDGNDSDDDDDNDAYYWGPDKNKVKLRKDGNISFLCADQKTSDGYNIKVYEFYVDKYYPRFDVYLNGQLIVEEEMIHANTIREIENSMK